MKVKVSPINKINLISGYNTQVTDIQNKGYLVSVLYSPKKKDSRILIYEQNNQDKFKVEDIIDVIHSDNRVLGKYEILSNHELNDSGLEDIYKTYDKVSFAGFLLENII
jgi:hypothetical protein